MLSVFTLFLNACCLALKGGELCQIFMIAIINANEARVYVYTGKVK